MAKGSLFRGQKNGGYCNIHKGINFNNPARGCSCLFLFIRKQHAQKMRAEGPAASRVRGTAPAPGPPRTPPRTPRRELHLRGRARARSGTRGARGRPSGGRARSGRLPASPSQRPLRAAPPNASRRSAPAHCRPARLGRPDSPSRRAGAGRGERGGSAAAGGDRSAGAGREGAGEPARSAPRHTKEPPRRPPPAAAPPRRLRAAAGRDVTGAARPRDGPAAMRKV